MVEEVFNGCTRGNHFRATRCRIGSRRGAFLRAPSLPEHRIDAHPIQLRFSGTPRGFEQAFLELRAALDGAEVEPEVRSRYNIELVFEEIVGNIVRYGAPQGGDLCVTVSVDVKGGRIVMMFENDGIAFDPCGRSDSPTLTTLAEAPYGGFGLTIVRCVASSMQYERAAAHNRLVVTLPAL
jgi:anti-sigma regulatory factor (Ser/Thr protein kinase)